jgi:hypothetical protein
MNDFSYYKSMVIAYYSNHELFIGDIPETSSAETINTFILSIKKDFLGYQKQLKMIDLERANPKGNDNLYLLEGKIHYLANAFPKQVFSKTNNKIKEEFIVSCNDALAIFPYAYFASIGLARVYEVQGMQTEAYTLVENMWLHGFHSKYILDLLIYLSLLNKDWKNAKEYSTYAHPIIYKLLLLIFFYIRKYRIDIIFFFLIIIISINIKPWFIVPIVIFLLQIIIHISSYVFKSRVVHTASLIGLGHIIIIFIITSILVFRLGLNY